MMKSLGIDAAWTNRQPSGVCLIKSEDGNQCKIIRLGRSYAEFESGDIEWNQKLANSTTSLSKILTTCSELVALPDCIAVDMPISSYHIKSRRECETAISKEYGGRGASTHNPNEDRPGLISVELFNYIINSGYLWMTNGMDHKEKSLIEVYPHTAIIEYLGLDYRYEYKVSKKNKFKSWALLSPSQRQQKLIQNLNNLVSRLSIRVPNIYDFFIELNLETHYTQAQLKGYEDAIDSVICALIGIDYIMGNIIGYGNNEGTIWVPQVKRR
ncbi:MAG: DUF429 domain-containing protein [Bacillota bacterium]|nr:DUF429 domain-containing protein [Bacillota bacterium]